MIRLFPVFVILILLAPCAFALEGDADEAGSLQADVDALRAQIEDQQQRHADEIDRLNRRIDELEAAGKAPASTETTSELDKLRLAAQSQASGSQARNESADTVFKSGGLGLQSLNPEISVTGDFLYTYSSGRAATTQSDFNFRGLGLHFESYLDPYTRFKAAVPVNSAGAELGEAYMTRYALLNNWNATLGKFRQQFGVVNRWHKHALDYVDFPMPLRRIFGEGGLNQTGIAFDWTGCLGSTAQEFEIQITDGENPRVFAQNTLNRPAILAHHKVNMDLSPGSYLELGATGMLGWNNSWDVSGGLTPQETRPVQAYGVDVSYLWEPTDKMRYRNVEARAELYALNKGILAPDGSGRDTLTPWGAYASLQSKVSRTVDVGARFDYYQPDVKNYAGLPGLSLSPLAVTSQGAYETLSALYVTWWQSPFVKFRVEYDYQDGKGAVDPLHQVFLQCVFAAGPHKHDRY